MVLTPFSGSCTTHRRKESAGIDTRAVAAVTLGDILPCLVDERLEQALVLSCLGVPENAERKPSGRVFERLGRPVPGPGGLDQAGADAPDALVVTRLDSGLARTEHGGQLRSFLDLDRMLGEHAAHLTMFRVSDGVREVLDEVTAPHDVEELEAAADGQDRNVALEGGLQERHLGAIATRLRLVRLRVRLCAVRIRPDVGTAGEDEDRKSTRLNSSHLVNSDAVFCLK